MFRYFLLTLCSCACICFAKNESPNILMIIVDDLRPQLGCYGATETLSPNIDRIADEGTLFETAYVQVPVCGASRASLMTGLYPTSSRFVTYYSSADKDAAGIPDIPKHLKSSGYTTISNGKIYHNVNDNTNSWSEIHRSPDFRIYLDEATKRMFEDKDAAYEAADVEDDAYPSGKMTKKIINDLRKHHKNDEPFFITAGYTKPHLPFNAPKKYWDLYDRSKIDLADNHFAPKGAPSQSLHKWHELRSGYGGMPSDGPVSDDLARILIHGYYACVSYTDKLIGDLLDELENLDIHEDTIVLLMGDHGWQLGEHALWCKHSLYETSLHTPLIIKAPGFKKGQKTDALVEFVDIYPTICDLAGITKPTHLQGKSLVTLMEDTNAKFKDAIFARYHGGETIRSDIYQYSEWKGGASMFYDHSIDPDENINRINDPKYKSVIQKMKKRLKEHREQL